MERLLALVRWVHERRDSYRLPLLICAFSAFAIGGFISFRALHVSPGDLRPGPLGMVALLVIPSLIYGGVGLVLLARSAGTSITLGRATVVAAYAYLAELLPLPGGAIVRAGALIGAGGTLQRSAALVLATAVLWIALAMIGAGLTLLPNSPPLAWPVLLTGSGISLVVTIWLACVSSAAIALQTLAHRVFGILLTGLRLQFAFAALGTAIGFVDVMPFVLALLAGSASSIAPAGLGISESLAALAATAISYPPGIAFLAVGLDRLLCLVGCGILALIVQHAKPLFSGGAPAPAKEECPMPVSPSGAEGHSLTLHSGAYVEMYKSKPISRVSNLVDRMGLTPQTRIADFACGNGMLLQAIGDAFASYDGIDFSPDFVAAAEEWAEETERKHYRFHCCDIRDFSAKNLQKFDVAATLDFSEHIEDPLAIEIYAAIRCSLIPGGRLFLHTPNLDFLLERAKQIGVISQFPEHVAVRNGEQTAKLLERAGFEPGKIAVKHIPHYNSLKALHPLSKLPLIGSAFAARLWVEAAA